MPPEGNPNKQDDIMFFVLFVVFAYCAGSINFAILFFRLLKKEDPRDRFSGNPGVTNVYRQAGPAAALAVLFLDAGRAAAVAGAGLFFLSPPGVVWSGLALLLGNRFPCFHRFSGGKGVANYLGFSAVIVPLAALVSLVAWAVAFLLVRQPFVASFFMVAVLAGATIFKWAHHPLAVAGAAATAALIVFNHRGNIAGLLNASS